MVTCSKFIDNQTIYSAIETKENNSSKAHHSIMRYDLESSINLQPIVLKGLLLSITNLCYQKKSNNLIIEDSSSEVYIYDINSGLKIFDSTSSRKMQLTEDEKLIVCSSGGIIKQIQIPTKNELLEKAKSKISGYALSEEDKTEYYL